MGIQAIESGVVRHYWNFLFPYRRKLEVGASLSQVSNLQSDSECTKHLAI
jgi:hypothetical protein